MLSGTIRADDGKPVRRAVVRLNGSDQAGTRVAVTDDTGRFTLSRLTAASFTISATRAGYVSAYYGSKRPGRGPALPIALATGQRLTVEMTMLRGAAIAGTITDPFGHPAPQVTVQAQLGGAPASATMRLTEAAPNFTTTDDRGSFRIYGLAPGDYIVSAFPRTLSAGDAIAVTSDDVQWAQQQLSGASRAGPGAATAAAAPLPPAGRAVVFAPVYFPGTTLPGTATTITLAAGEDREGLSYPLQFVPTARIDGMLAGVAGQTGVDAAVVMLLPKTADSAPALRALVDAGLATAPRASVSADGRFALAGLTPGQYVVIARVGPLGPARDAGPGAETLWGETEIAVDGRDLPDVAITLQRGPSLSGAIVFEGSSLAPPADLASVHVSLVSSRYMAPPIASGLEAAVTPRGTFTFTSMMPGPYSVKVVAPAGPAGAPHWTLKSIVAGGRDLTDGTLDLRTGGDVSGVVVTFTDKETELSGTLLDAAGKPTPAFSIVVFTTNRAFWTPGSRRVQSVRPATNGTFRVTGLPAGEYWLAAVADLDATALSDPGYLEQIQSAGLTITLADGEKTKQDLKLQGG